MGDSSKTEQMQTFAHRELDYALINIQGIPHIASEWAEITGAKHNIPMHTSSPGVLFERNLAELLSVNRLIVEPGEEIEL